MINVWFYSSDDSDVTVDMDIDLFNSLRRTHPKVTFIASHYSNINEHYQEFKERFDRLGKVNHNFVTVDRNFNRSRFLRLLDSDLIYLDGGNTYYFLHHLKRNGLLPLLRDYVREGGVLAGTSAGAIIMTQTIRTAGFPEFDKDDNFVGITNLESLGLVGFEFFPHFDGTKRYIVELKKESEFVNMPIYAAPDGGGVHVCGRKLVFYDNCFSFYDGIVTPLNPF
jgi:dipeptidase E